jgi:hypothetical protein
VEVLEWVCCSGSAQFSCIGDVLAQTRQPGALSRGQRLAVAGCRGLDATPLIGDPPPEQTLVHAQFARDMVTSFQRDHSSRHFDVHHSGGVSFAGSEPIAVRVFDGLRRNRLLLG